MIWGRLRVGLAEKGQMCQVILFCSDPELSCEKLGAIAIPFTIIGEGIVRYNGYNCNGRFDNWCLTLNYRDDTPTAYFRVSSQL
jgi:hypothetical protein